jgi:hypothetical protein
MLEEFAGEPRHQRHDVGEVPGEECIDGPAAVERSKAFGAAFQGKEQRDGEAAVDVRQRDQHEAAARPDVQRIALDAVRAVRSGWQREFLVAVLEHVFDHAHAKLAGHRAPHDGTGAVCGDQWRERLRVRITRDFVEHDEFITLEIERAGRLQEAGFDPMTALRMIEQCAVQARPRDGVNDFVRPLAVGREREGSIRSVQRATPHRYQQRLDVLEHAGRTQRMNAAVRQCQVDRAACIHVDLAQVRAAFVHLHLPALPREVDGHQRAGQTGAQYRDGSLHASSSACRASTQRHTSSKRL